LHPAGVELAGLKLFAATVIYKTVGMRWRTGAGKETCMSRNKIGLAKALSAAAILAALSLAPLAGAHDTKGTSPAPEQARLAEKVRHELVMLPWYGVFDDLSFELENGGTVVLKGKVWRPILKSDAEGVVRRIEGVKNVVNQIEVLPLSRFDDQLRFAIYRAIYSRPGLDLYALRAIPPIHIIVKNGDITLTGVVGTEADKILAGMVAREIPGSFRVTNELLVQKGA
jgi:hyperosmotically inducible protein